MKLIKKGQQQAFSELYHRYNQLLLLYAHKKLLDKEAAQDIVQDVFVAVWENREQLEINDSVKAYQRWYNVKVVYEGQLPNKRITGEIKRTKDLNLVLRLLNEASDLNFKLKNDTIVVGASTLKP